MGKLLIVNGSPRAPKSNSREYASIFRSYWQGETVEYLVTAKKPEAVYSQLEGYEHILLAFPLYADGLPVPLMRFLKGLEEHSPSKKPVVHVLINCGFFEPEQNRTAVDMVRLFCKKNGFPIGMTVCIGSGEAILLTPFAYLVKQKIKRMVKGIRAEKSETIEVTMPLTKKMFLRASTNYWRKRGLQNGLTREQMETMTIECH